MITVLTKEKGGAVRVLRGVKPDELARVAGNVCFIELTEPTKEEGAILASVFHFHQLAIDDCWEEVNHPKADDYGNYLFMVLHEPRYGDRKFSTREIEFFLGRTFLLSFHKHPLSCIEEVIAKVEKRPELFERGPDFLLYLILDYVVDGYFPVLDKLEARIDQLEDSIVRNPTNGTVDGIFSMKREVLHLKKVIGPQREMLNRFTRAEFPQIQKSTLVYFRDLYDHIYRIYDMIESFRDLLSGALDAYLSSLSNRMNEIMKVLTIITTILLPLTLITGIYGMNFKFMPELTRPWGYPFALGLMVVIAVAMLLFFKKKKWL